MDSERSLYRKYFLNSLRISSCFQHINEKPQVVSEYESGKAVPNQQILAKMERALGVKLRGKDIGKPFGAKPVPAKK